MSMNSTVAPESIRALMDMGALLSTVLSCSGMLVPLQSVSEHMRKGSSSGMACLVLSSVVTGDCRVKMSSVDPTVLFLVLRTYWLDGVWISPLTGLKTLFGSFYLICCISGVHHCCDCFGYKAFDVNLIGLSQVNPLLPRFQAVTREVAFLITVIASVGLLFA